MRGEWTVLRRYPRVCSRWWELEGGEFEFENAKMAIGERNVTHPSFEAGSGRSADVT